MIRNPRAGFGSSAANEELRRASIARQFEQTNNLVTELANTLSDAVEYAGYSLSGPSDHRAAENNEPKWVCKARGLIAEAKR